MRTGRILWLMGICGLSLMVLSSCDRTSNKCVSTAIENNNVATNRIDSIPINIFGVEAQNDEYSVVNSLEEAGVIKIDSIRITNGQFQFAIVEFAGVKSGMNPGFTFLTSERNSHAIKSLVEEISKYYGEPRIDCENGDEIPDEYSYYYWPIPGIRIRPEHREDGGLVMMWGV